MGSGQKNDHPFQRVVGEDLSGEVILASTSKPETEREEQPGRAGLWHRLRGAGRGQGLRPVGRAGRAPPSGRLDGWGAAHAARETAAGALSVLYIAPF